MEKVGVVGGGAIGLLLASYLCKSGCYVTVYTKTEAQANELNQNGIFLIRDNNKLNVRVKSMAFERMDQLDDDLLFVTVKQYDLNNIISCILKAKGKVQSVIFVQNGMGHVKDLDKLKSKAENIYVGIIEHGALRNSMIEVVHTGVGEMKAGCYLKRSSHPTNLWTRLTEEGFSISMYNHWYDIMVKKLIANSVINPLTALFKINNGTLLTNKFYFELMKQLFDELSLIYDCDEADWQQIINICKKTSQNRSSMLKDIEEKRQTEIEAITGVILEKAKQKNIHLPYHLFLYNSIKGIELERKDGSL